jgi:vacuolar-type H+-ATPase subunit I/STV1
VTLTFSILFGYYTYLDIYYISFIGALSYLISSFSSLISLISGLIALYMIAFISSILGILDILFIGVAGITLGDNLVIKENIELPELARNSYISSLSSSVFCRFYRTIGCSEASISIEGAFRLGLFYLFYLFCSIFCVRVGVVNNNAKLSSSSVSSPF